MDTNNKPSSNSSNQEPNLSIYKQLLNDPLFKSELKKYYKAKGNCKSMLIQYFPVDSVSEHLQRIEALAGGKS